MESSVRRHWEGHSPSLFKASAFNVRKVSLQNSSSEWLSIVLDVNWDWSCDLFVYKNYALCNNLPIFQPTGCIFILTLCLFYTKFFFFFFLSGVCEETSQSSGLRKRTRWSFQIWYAQTFPGSQVPLSAGHTNMASLHQVLCQSNTPKYTLSETEATEEPIGSFLVLWCVLKSPKKQDPKVLLAFCLLPWLDD